MRLISQDGEIDVPYEHGSLCIGFIKGEEHIIDTISYYNYSSQKGTKLAEYSSKAKALKVMEMLREKYAKIELFKSVYQKGLLTELNKELGFDKMQNILTSIFQFPKDEEVEV